MSSGPKRKKVGEERQSRDTRGINLPASHSFPSLRNYFSPPRLQCLFRRSFKRGKYPRRKHKTNKRVAYKRVRNNSLDERFLRLYRRYSFIDPEREARKQFRVDTISVNRFSLRRSAQTFVLQRQSPIHIRDSLEIASRATTTRRVISFIWLDLRCNKNTGWSGRAVSSMKLIVRKKSLLLARAKLSRSR